MKYKVAVLGPGNIGTDLMFKIMRSRHLEMHLMAGIVESEGIKRAAGLGIKTSVDGADAIVADKEVRIVFDATSAAAHHANAPKFKAAGQIAIDLTPAAIGPYLVPCVNLDTLQNESNVNMVTCGGQATIPIVYAIQRVAGAAYAEIVACIAAKGAGPGTRANIDEFTETTAKALEVVAGADKGRAIIILNPAEPPLMMTNTVYVRIKNDVGLDVITRSVNDIVAEVQKYVPGYKLRMPPILDGDKVTAIVEVQGAGDFLPVYSGNLDIITSAAVAAAEKLAQKLSERGEPV